jgi:glycosyltransferase involved in cell wall biosynthesis
VERLRVTMMSSLPPHKGVTPYTLALMHALQQRDDVRVDAVGFRSMYPRFAYPGGDPRHANSSQAPVDNAPTPLAWWDPVSWVRTGMSGSGEVVHAQWWSWFLAPSYIATLTAAKRRGKKLVITAHNVNAHEDARWKQKLNDVVLRLSDRIIVHSQQNRDTLVSRGFDACRVSVVPHGALSLPILSATSRGSARRALGLPDNAQIVLLPGNLRTYKGARVLLASAAEVRTHVPNLRIIIAGELWKGCRDPRVDAQELGVSDLLDARIRYLPDDELGLLLAACDVVVLPYTHFDAQTGAGTLALSAHRALVVSSTGGLPDLVLDERAVVPPAQVGALSRALTAVLLDRGFQTKLERDSARVAADLSWDHVADRTVAVYRQVLGLDTSPRPLREAA